MSMEEKKIQIQKEGLVESKSSVTLHIDYNESLTLKELSEVLDSINKAFNDINREKGIKSNVTLGREYAAEITGVDSGSIVMYILTNFVTPVALSVLANYIYDRLKMISVKKEKNRDENESPIYIVVNGEYNQIEVNLLKPNSMSV